MAVYAVEILKEICELSQLKERLAIVHADSLCGNLIKENESLFLINGSMPIVSITNCFVVPGDKLVALAIASAMHPPVHSPPSDAVTDLLRFVSFADIRKEVAKFVEVEKGFIGVKSGTVCGELIKLNKHLFTDAGVEPQPTFLTDHFIVPSEILLNMLIALKPKMREP